MLILVTFADYYGARDIHQIYRDTDTEKYYYCAQTCYGPYLGLLTDEEVILGYYVARSTAYENGIVRVLRTLVPLPSNLSPELMFLAIRHRVA